MTCSKLSISISISRWASAHFSVSPKDSAGASNTPSAWAMVLATRVWPDSLVPDKSAALREMARALKPGGRLQIGDFLVQKAVPDGQLLV